jgi:hypothetical protein
VDAHVTNATQVSVGDVKIASPECPRVSPLGARVRNAPVNAGFARVFVRVVYAFARKVHAPSNPWGTGATTQECLGAAAPPYLRDAAAPVSAKSCRRSFGIPKEGSPERSLRRRRSAKLMG